MHNEKWYIIANPAAGKGRVSRKLPDFEILLQRNGIDYQLVKTQRNGEAGVLAEKAIGEGFRKILAIGGDGTGNEVVNGVIGQKAVPSQEITFALLSIGTGNDWIKTHGIPRNLKLFIDMMKQGKTTFQDIGTVSYFQDGERRKRYFANIAGMAYDAFVVEKTKAQSGIFSTKLFYLVSLMRYLFEYRLQRAKVRFDSQDKDGYFYTINVGICKYAGGGMQIVPHAKPDDGQLAVTIAGKFTKPEVILNTYRFYNGTIAKHPKITTFQTKKLQVYSLESDQIAVEADGEFLGYTPVEFGIIPKALRILIP